MFGVSYSGGFVVVKIFGIKCKFNVKANYLYAGLQKNKIYLRSGNGNLRRIYCAPKGLKISFKGENSTIILSEKSRYRNSEIQVHSNCSVDIGKTTTLGFKDAWIYLYDDSNLSIGEDFNIEGGRLLVGQDSSLTIGNDCMFANGISIFTYDVHNIVDNVSKNVLNKPRDVVIGNHVWLARNVAVMKGAVVPDESIVAYGAVVTSQFDEPNVILAGTPAKVIKHGINWTR